jgi:hypothetical protein
MRKRPAKYKTINEKQKHAIERVFLFVENKFCTNRIYILGNANNNEDKRASIVLSVLLCEMVFDLSHCRVAEILHVDISSINSRIAVNARKTFYLNIKREFEFELYLETKM